MMMKKAVLILCMALAAWLGATARTARDFFVAAPDDVMPLLPQSVRLDMLDYFAFGSTRPSTNAFGGEARMTALSDAVLAFDTDKDVNVQIAVIPTAKSDTLLALVTTLRMPVADSDVQFFTTGWEPAPKAPFSMPTYAEWLSAEGLRHSDDVHPELPFMPVSAEFDPEARMLMLSNQAPEYLDKSRRDSIAPRIVASRVYDITDGKFMLRK